MMRACRTLAAASLALTPAIAGCTSDQGETLDLAPGTSVVVELSEPLSSAADTVGDLVRARTLAPVESDGRVVVPAGSTVRGMVVEVEPLGEPRMTIAFEELELPDGARHAIVVRPIRLVGDAGDGRRATETGAEPVTVHVDASADGEIHLAEGRTLALQVVDRPDIPERS